MPTTWGAFPGMPPPYSIGEELPDALGQSFVVRHAESQDTVVATRSKDVGRVLSESDTMPCRGRAR